MAGPAWLGRVPWRWVVVVMFSLGLTVAYMLRICLSTAIVPMSIQYGWSSSEQGWVLSSFYYGMILTPCIGGYLAERHGSKTLMLLGIAWTLVFSALTPLAAPCFPCLLIVRLLVGMGQGQIIPTMHVMFSNWIPPHERSRAVPLGWGGGFLGTVFSMLLSGPIVNSWGWPAVFYIYSIVGVVWLVTFFFLTANAPRHHHFISRKEIHYIHSFRETEVVEEDEVEEEEQRAGKLGGELNGNVASPLLKDKEAPTTTQDITTALYLSMTNMDPKVTAIPWKTIWTSIPFWGLILAHFAYNWGFFILLSWLPTYFVDELGFDLNSSAFVSALPYVFGWIMSVASGVAADWLIGRPLDRTGIRKTFYTVGSLYPALFLSLLPFVPAYAPYLAVLLMTLGVGMTGISLPGFGPNHIELGPQYSGVLMGITNTAATLPGVFGVLIAGLIVDATGSFGLVFWLTAAIYVAGTGIFVVMGSTDRCIE